MIYFITGSKNKFSEVKSILEKVEQFDIDLPEIQEIDVKKIIENKLYEAKKHHDGEFIVEDTSLYLDCLNGLPGPLIKWFLKTIGNKGLYEITQKLGNDHAQAKTIIGYMSSKGEINFFEGILNGKIVSPIGENGFGWDEIFIPDNYNKTFAQMRNDEKNQISMRIRAVNKLKEFLDK
ncbi:MAG TPA: non-canonical purine NTP pyrophosphatase [bacterium]|nr:non-canonical purine NTP pyrophosphatase [bacterium]